MLYLKRAHIVLVIFALIMSACAKKDEYSSQEEKLRNELKANPDDSSAFLELMTLLYQKSDKEDFFKEYEANKGKLINTPVVQCYYGTLLTAKAQEEKEPQNKLKFLKLGMIHYEKLKEQFPQSKSVYQWKALTYSNFPPMFDVKDDILEELDVCIMNYKKGTWPVSINDWNMYFRTCINVTNMYRDKEFYNLALEQLEMYYPDNDAEIYKELESLRSSI